MKKQKPKTTKPRARSSIHDSRAVRRPLDPLESALGAAARLAEPYPEEAEAIDNVIRFVRDHRHGHAAEVRLSDVLLALSTILGATDHALTPEERSMLGILEVSLGIPASAGMVRLPGSAAHLPLAHAPRRHPHRASYASAPISPFPHVRFAA